MNNKNTGMVIITIAVLAALTAVLDMFAIITFPTGILSVSSFYIGSAFFLLFVYLFSWQGAIGIYLGLIVSSIITSGFSVFPIYGAWGNVIANVFIVVVMSAFDRSCELKTKSDFSLMLVLFVIAPMISAAWVLGGWVVAGIIPKTAFIPAFIPWWIGGVAVYFIVGIPIMRLLAPLLKKYKLA